MNPSTVEKIALAREFRIRPWFDEGVMDLVLGTSRPPLELLIENLGLETTSHILRLQGKVSLIGRLSCSPKGENPFVRNGCIVLSAGDLKCGTCFKPAFKEAVICASKACKRAHELEGDRVDTLYTVHEEMKVVGSHQAGGEFVGLQANAEKVGCVHCTNQFLPHVGVPCAPCGSERGKKLFFIGYTLNEVREAIEAAFAEEFQEYEN